MFTRILQIVDGPPFRSFVIQNKIVSGSSFDTTFTMDENVPSGAETIHHHNAKKYQLTVKALSQTSDDEDEFGFIGKKVGRLIRKPGYLQPEIWYYIGTYNPKTRKGTCLEMTEKEFFKSEIMRFLFGKVGKISISKSMKTI